MSAEKVFHQLSESQKSIWYLEKAYPGTSLNIIAGNMRLKGEICYPALEKALNIFVKKNESMRIRIKENDGIATQYVTEYEEFKVDFFDFSKGGGLKDLFLWDEEKTRSPLDINENNLFYCAVFKISDEEGGAYMRLHHLISDAWTLGLVTRQLIEIYSNIINGLPVDETPSPSFIKHLHDDAEYEKSNRFENDKSYWNNKFETLPEMTLLKPLKSGDVAISARRKTLITPLKLSNKIREFCTANNLSVFTLFMSALSIYINRVTGIEDIILGTTILNRTNTGDKETTGMFVSVAAPCRIAINDSMDFRTFAKVMLKECVDVLRHQKYPYNYLIKDLKKTHKFSNRLFDIVLSYQNSKFHKNETEVDYVTKWIFSGCQVESLIISINDREDSGNLIIDYDFLTDVFDIKEIEFIHQHIISLLWHALDNPSRKISKLEMISEKEKRIILRDFNNTYANYPMEKTINQMFEEQAEKTPDNTALILKDKTMTYAELNSKANMLARTLRDKGVGPDKVVGILAYRSFELITGIMGILKAGGAYLPIDPDYPLERQRYMLENSGAEILLIQHDLISAVEYEGEIIDIEEVSSYKGDGQNLPALNSSGDLAYIIYTSGSTGNPKGVMVKHTGVVNSFCWGVKKFSLTSDSIILQKTAPTFDPSVWEIFWWLMLGGKVCLIESGDEKDPEAIITAIEKYQVTAMHFVPSMMGLFLNYVESTSAVGRLASLKQVLSCGEAISLNQVEHFNRLLNVSNATALYNMYGPTEATVEVSCYDCSPSVSLASVPLGERIDNFNIYILDKNKNLLPIGIPGEIYISGAGLSRGYLNNPELTEDRFMLNPFVHGEKMYRTGDRARWYPMGDIEFLGRMDFQVKIKGYRIELGEIESKLLRHDSILEAAVKPFTDDSGNTYLAAFLVKGKNIEADEVRQYLSEMLPDYMVPACVEFLDKMPLNNNGKTDRNALPKPGNMICVSTDYAPPSNEIETSLSDIWSRTLGLTRVGVNDEYTSLGGDSLSAIKIITEIHKSFGVEISPKYIFQLQTIRKLSDRIAVLSRHKTDYVKIPPITASTYYEVSSAQKRLYILDKIDGGISYNLPGGLVIKGIVDIKTINDIFNKITRRHESLRTSFEMRNGQPVQMVHEHLDITVDHIHTDDTDFDKLMASFVIPFDLSQAPLFRARLVSFSERKHLLLFDMHHIISDGASVNILIREMSELLNLSVLPDSIGVQYKDFSAWHNKMLNSDDMKDHEAYWLDRFSGEIPVLNMPLDFMRPSFQSFKGDKLHFTIDEALTADIKKLTARTGTTLFMLLLGAYNILLSKYSGQEDVIVGTPVEGRRHDDLRHLIGMFVNTLAIRTQPDGGKQFSGYLREIKDEILNAFDHQEYPFEELVERLDTRRDTSRNPLFDTMFVLQNMDLKMFNAGGLAIKPYSFNNKTAKFDLTLEASDKVNTIECTFEYCTDLFKEESISRLSCHLINTLKGIIDNPEAKICDIDLLSEAERHQLLTEFNDTDADYPRDKTIHQLFEEQALRTPDNIALVFDDSKMTYAELNKKANRLARTLRVNGVGPDDIVGILVDRSFEMIVSILAILKAGGAYMPIDPEYPEDRKKYMLENSGAKVLLAKKAFEVPIDGTTVYLDEESSYDRDDSDLSPVNRPSDLAYIIYTSGSTGKPKGVMIEHRNVVRLLFNSKFQFDFSEADSWTLFHSYGFDFSVWEMYGALLYGGNLIIITKEAAIDTRQFLDIVKAQKVTVLNQTPSAFYNLIDMDMNSDSEITSLRYIIFGGEALKTAMLKTFKEKYPSVKLINMYGITETTVHVTYKEITLDDIKNNRSIVGVPIPTLKTFVLDKHLNLLPIGAPGEICVAGAGVSRGYLHNEKLTKEKFVQLSYLCRDKIYRSGDLGKLLHNGEIEYLGRIDSQAKIRGFRIELGEIENALLKHPQIEETVITVHETEGRNKKLCAYIRSKSELSPKELISYLSGNLPDYMIPSYFIRVDIFPLNRNGKVDNTRLPEPYDAYTAGLVSILPRNVMEEIVAGAWAQVLDVQEVGIDDNFFELGGDSLSAIKVVSMLKLGINLVDFYTNPTVRLLTEKLKNENRETGVLVKLSRRKISSKGNIVCFPYGGGSALAFRDLSNSLHKKNVDFDIYSVNLPGHDFGIQDELKPIEQVAEELAKEIAGNLTGELILYSHCVGSALLLATVSLLFKAGIPIKAVFIGGVLIPKFIRLYGRFLNPWTFYSDNSIVRYLKKIGLPKKLTNDNEYLKYMITAFKHDAKCFTSYLYSLNNSKELKYNLPLYFVVGDKDVTTKNYLKRYLQWNRFFSDVKLVVIKNAYHYFINSHADDIIDCIIAI